MTMTGCLAAATTALALVLAAVSSAPAQSHDRSIGSRNFALSNEEAIAWGAAQSARPPRSCERSERGTEPRHAPGRRQPGRDRLV